jgi:hypothetical protein
MQAESKEKLRAIAGQLESALGTFESILETEDLAALYRASHAVKEALKALHEQDPALMTPGAASRIQGMLKPEGKKQGGRDNFNTGF